MSRIILIFFLISGIAHAAPGGLGDSNGQNNNPHNLSSLSNNAIKAETETQICVFCHIPHGANYESTLWSRLEPQGGPFPTFDESRTQDPNNNLGLNDPSIIATTQYGVGEYPNGASKMCLSCHDGVTAIGTVGNGDFISVMSGGSGGVGATMTDVNSVQHFGASGNLRLDQSHPISFIYTQAVVDYLNSTNPTDIKFYDFSLPTASVLDGKNRVQCTTCHEPHYDTKDGTYTLPFWRKYTGNVVTDYDDTCQECHSTTYYSGSNHNIP